MECQWCKKILKTNLSLKVHQKSAKYCLKIQGEVTKGEFVCPCCQKDFTQKVHLSSHMQTCEQNTLYIKELHTKIQELEKQLAIFLKENQTLKQDKKDLLKHSETLAKQPKYTQNKTINITQNLAIFNPSDDFIERLVEEKYDKEHLIDGQKGAARFTKNNIINSIDGKDVYQISDKNRGHGLFRSGVHSTTKDNFMVELSDKVYEPIKQKATKLYRDDFNNDELQKGWNDVYMMNDDNTSFRKEIVRLCSQGAIGFVTDVNDTVPDSQFLIEDFE